MNWRRFLWVALLASLGTMVLMQYLQKNTAAKPESAQTQPLSAAPTPAPAPASLAPAGASTTTGPAQSHWALERETQLKKVTLGGLDRNGWKIEVQLTNEGAAIESLYLSDYFKTVEDKRAHEKDPAGYRDSHIKGDVIEGYYQILKPVHSTAGIFLPLATQKLSLPKDGLEPIDLSTRQWNVLSADGPGGKSATFTVQLNRDDKPYLLVKKTYTLEPESYSLLVKLEFINTTDHVIQCDLTQFGVTGIPREVIQGDKRSLTWAQLLKGEPKVSLQDLQNDKNLGMWPKVHELGLSESVEPILWVGQTNKFFASLLYLVPSTAGLLNDSQAKATFFDAGLIEPRQPPPEDPSVAKTYLSGVRLGPYDLDPQSTTVVNMDLFAGPKKVSVLEAGRYGQLRYLDVIETSSSCTSGWLTRSMIWLLNMFSKVTFGNYGLAIILLVGCVRLALHPLTKKSQVSMSKMQNLQPELARIREKYKDDKAKLNAETMQLYKQGGATPILGCLPMLLQMPIWIALYSALSASVELRHAGFLPVWITDLAAPDALISFSSPIHVPLANWTLTSFNLLPILLTIAMILQQKFTPMSSATMDEQQARQQKRMMYFMNGFFLLIFYNMPSGLNLYIMSSTFAGVAEQWVIRRHIQQRKADEAARETQIVVPGKASRLSRPKKPKGPFRG